MNTNEFMEGIHLLQDNYQKKLSKEQLKLFYENLKDLSQEKYIANIKANIKSNPFMPNIAQIRGENKQKDYIDYKQREYSYGDLSRFYLNKGE